MMGNGMGLTREGGGSALLYAERRRLRRRLKNMISKHSWIETEKDAFGVAGGDYDFEETNPQEMSTHLQALKAEQASLVSTFFLFVTRLLSSS